MIWSVMYRFRDIPFLGSPQIWDILNALCLKQFSERQGYIRNNNIRLLWARWFEPTKIIPVYLPIIHLFQVFDHDTLSDDVIATHYIDLSTIMHNGDNAGFLPQIGPCYVNLYGAPRYSSVRGAS
jgi:hypothetical protein